MIFQGQGPNWQDFLGIVCLLIINSSISFIEESNAENATAALMVHLTPKTKVNPSHNNFKKKFFFESSTYTMCLSSFARWAVESV